MTQSHPASEALLDTGLVLLTLVLSGCGGGGASPTRPTPTPDGTSPGVSSMSIGGAVPALGSTSQFTATATLSNGATQDVTAQAIWESSNVTVVAVSSGGLVTAVAVGEADLRATYQGASASRHVAVTPPPLLVISGTVFIDPNILTPSDPTVFIRASYVGTGNRRMFDRRRNAFVTYNAFLFDATFSDGLRAEIQVNPEFQTSAAAMTEAEKYGRLIGQLPTALRTDMQTMWIHQGVEPFGGGNNNVLIHTGQAADYESRGVLEEALVHEATHTSLDARHAGSAGWIRAQQADMDFISTYARDFPSREDVAESFLPWMALRFRRARLSPQLAYTIMTRTPNRLAYFDDQSFRMSPVN